MALPNYQLRAIKTAALVLGAIIPIYIALYQWSGPLEVEFIAIGIWVVSPYICLLVVTVLLERFSAIKKIFLINCVVAVLILGFTAWTYWIALDDTSNTSGLIFIFGPAWVYIISFFVLGVTLLGQKLTNKGT